MHRMGKPARCIAPDGCLPSRTRWETTFPEPGSLTAFGVFVSAGPVAGARIPVISDTSRRSWSGTPASALLPDRHSPRASRSSTVLKAERVPSRASATPVAK